MRKILFLLTLLLCVCSGAWAQDEVVIIGSNESGAFTIEGTNHNVAGYSNGTNTSTIAAASDGQVVSGGSKLTKTGNIGSKLAEKGHVRFTVEAGETVRCYFYTTSKSQKATLSTSDYSQSSSYYHPGTDVTSDDGNQLYFVDFVFEDAGTYAVSVSNNNSIFMAALKFTAASVDERTPVELTFTANGETSVTLERKETQATQFSIADATGVSAGNYSYEFTSDDESVAQISSDGVIKAIGAGTTTVKYVVTTNEDAEFGGNTAEISVTVTDESITTVTKKWDFTQEMSAADIANLTAAVEANEWTYDESNNRYSPTFSSVSSNGEYVTLEANGEKIHWVDGLLFGKPSGKISGSNIRLDNGLRFQWNSTSVGIKIQSLKKDDIINIDFSATGKDNTSTITMDNATLSSEEGTNIATGTDKATATFTVDTDGDVVLLSDQVRYYTISVTTQTPIETAEVTEYGWASFNSDCALDFTGTDYAYQVTGVEGSTITLVPVRGAVAANTPLILKGTEGETTTLQIPVATSGADLSDTNKLVAVVEDNTTVAKENGKTKYVLSVQNEKAVFALINADAATLKKGQAYLELDSEAEARVLFFDGETTGINAMQMNNEVRNNEYFNLAGQRVAKPTKGLYIVNGKKVVIK